MTTDTADDDGIEREIDIDPDDPIIHDQDSYDAFIETLRDEELACLRVDYTDYDDPIAMAVEDMQEDGIRQYVEHSGNLNHRWTQDTLVNIYRPVRNYTWTGRHFYEHVHEDLISEIVRRTNERIKADVESAVMNYLHQEGYL